MKVDLLFSGGLHKYIRGTAYLFSLWNIMNEKVKKANVHPEDHKILISGYKSGLGTHHVIVNCYNVLLLFVLQDK